MAKKVKVISKTNQAWRLRFPELRVNRLFDKEGQSYLFDEDVIEEMFYYPAVEGAFKKGLFYIDDKELRIKLGLEEENGEVPSDVTVPISDTTILAHLKTMSVAEFKKLFEKLPMEQKLRFVDIAIKNKITDYEKCNIIKNETGKDIMKIVQLNEE